MTAPQVLEKPLRQRTLRHAYCTRCNPTGSITRVALCGQLSAEHLDRIYLSVPPNACVVCLDLWERPCGWCGL